MDLCHNAYQFSMSVFILSVVCDFAAARGSPAQNVQNYGQESQ